MIDVMYCQHQLVVEDDFNHEKYCVDCKLIFDKPAEDEDYGWV